MPDRRNVGGKVHFDSWFNMTQTTMAVNTWWPELSLCQMKLMPRIIISQWIRQQRGIRREEEETPKEVENREGNILQVKKRVRVGQPREKKERESSEAEPRYTGKGSKGSNDGEQSVINMSLLKNDHSVH